MDKKNKIALIVGARPNFMKSAPLIRELKQFYNKFKPLLIHTGQHYDRNLSQLFFEQLEMAEPDIYLGIGSDTHARQTAKMMIELEEVFSAQNPDLIVVFGDVNSTMAAALVAAKLGIKIAHVEAGLRSFDSAMPEEINRIVTDRLSDILFITENSARINLLQEGVSLNKIHFVGNIMIDSLVNNIDKARSSKILKQLAVTSGNFALITMHRPANVDDKDKLIILFKMIEEMSEQIPVVFPCHPRTQNRLHEIGFNNPSNNNTNSLKIIDALGYLDFLNLQANAKLVLTDSGGVQEETTYLGVPCITMRENTERPITVEVGTNVIAGMDPKVIADEVNKILSGKYKAGKIPELWDGKTAERIMAILSDVL